MLKTIFLAVLLLVVGGLAAWSLWIRSLEQPNYAVVDNTDAYELRRYDAYLVAETSVSGRFEDSGNRAFRLLAGYIFGRNTSELEMAMTAPVVSTREAGPGTRMAMTAPVFSETVNATTDGERGASVWRYQFVMERKYTLATLPKPLDSRVTLKKVPARLVAVRRFSGSWSQQRFAEQEARLLAAVNRDGLTTRGIVVQARYDDPFTLPFLRRNEVMVEIADGGHRFALAK